MKDSNLKALLKVYSIYFKSKIIDGLEIYHNSTTEVEFYGQKVSVPLLKINNSNNIPFSYYSLAGIIMDEFDTIQSFSATNFPFNTLEKIIVFDDFTGGQFYLPQKTEGYLKKCINNRRFKINYREDNEIFTLEGKYIVNDDFEMYWEDSENFRIDVSIEVFSLWGENLVSKTYGFIKDSEKIKEIITDIRDEHFLFENPIWDCIQDGLMEHKVFIDTDWQYVSINVIPSIEYL